MRWADRRRAPTSTPASSRQRQLALRQESRAQWKVARPERTVPGVASRGDECPVRWEPARMARQTIRDRGRGFLMLDAHPAGCQRTVDQMWAATPPAEPADGEGPVALVIGSSAGYGLAATVVGLARHRVSGVAVALERSADNRRNATAGWYRTARTGELARQ